MSKPQGILKAPYVFEYLDAREEKPMLEKDLEIKLIRHIEDFLLELGRGFMFVGSNNGLPLATPIIM
jgi:predicted nuclease of restriction endonuclease-like (RecB) superfamily